jgi:hypothetical protein
MNRALREWRLPLLLGSVLGAVAAFVLAATFRDAAPPASESPAMNPAANADAIQKKEEPCPRANRKADGYQGHAGDVSDIDIPAMEEHDAIVCFFEETGLGAGLDGEHHFETVPVKGRMTAIEGLARMLEGSGEVVFPDGPEEGFITIMPRERAVELISRGGWSEGGLPTVVNPDFVCHYLAGENPDEAESTCLLRPWVKAP